MADKKHEFRIEYVPVKRFSVLNQIGAGACWWTASFRMENGIKPPTSKGKLVISETEWCLSPD